MSLQRRYLGLTVARCKNKHTSTNGSKGSIPYEIRALSVAVRDTDSSTRQFEPPSWQSNLSNHNRRPTWAKHWLCEISCFLLRLRYWWRTFLCPLLKCNIVRSQHSDIWVDWELYCLLNCELELSERPQREEMLITDIYSYISLRHPDRFNQWYLDWPTWSFRRTFYRRTVWIVCCASVGSVFAIIAKFWNEKSALTYSSGWRCVDSYLVRSLFYAILHS